MRQNEVNRRRDTVLWLRKAVDRELSGELGVEIQESAELVLLILVDLSLKPEQ